MKGLLFGGCSFTWGQGLYFYSDLPDLYYPKPYEYHVDIMVDRKMKLFLFLKIYSIKKENMS